MDNVIKFSTSPAAIQALRNQGWKAQGRSRSIFKKGAVTAFLSKRGAECFAVSVTDNSALEEFYAGSIGQSVENSKGS